MEYYFIIIKYLYFKSLILFLHVLMYTPFLLNKQTENLLTKINIYY